MVVSGWDLHQLLNISQWLCFMKSVITIYVKFNSYQPAFPPKISSSVWPIMFHFTAIQCKVAIQLLINTTDWIQAYSLKWSPYKFLQCFNNKNTLTRRNLYAEYLLIGRAWWCCEYNCSNFPLIPGHFSKCVTPYNKSKDTFTPVNFSYIFGRSELDLQSYVICLTCLEKAKRSHKPTLAKSCY